VENEDGDLTLLNENITEYQDDVTKVIDFLRE